MSVVTFLMLNWSLILSAIIIVLGAAATLFGALVALFLIIPGKHPEDWFEAAGKACESAKNFLSKFSRK